MTAVLFPDIEAILVTYLADELADHDTEVTVSNRVPSPRPARFVTVRRVGGITTSVVTDAATVAVEAWSQSDEDAHDLAQLCRALIHDMTGTVQSGATIYRTSEFGGPVNLPDPESEQPRYTLTVSVTARGSAL
jgi:hypothetical protein